MTGVATVAGTARQGVEHAAGVAAQLTGIRVGLKPSDMMRRQTTVEIDEGVLDALGRAAREDGRPEDEVVEEALRRYFGVRGVAVLDDIADAQATAGNVLDDEQAMALAVTELRAARAERARRATA